jgi:predicted MFS family arabinose efflux permease
MGQTAAVIAALWALPWLTSLVGWYSPFLMLAIAAVVSMLTLPVWSTGMRAQRAKFGVSISRRGLACLIGALIYYSGQAAAWGYLERIGTYEGISAHDVRLALTAAIVPGMLGSLMDYVVGRWISITAFLAYSLAITAVALLILSLQISPLLFAFAVTLFYFAWCASIPFQFAATVRADLQGDSAASLTAANSLGIAIGPAIAGGLFVRGAAPAVLVFAAICSVIGISFFVVSEISGAQQNLRREPCQ